jgi:hypothetical protein
MRERREPTRRGLSLMRLLRTAHDPSAGDAEVPDELVGRVERVASRRLVLLGEPVAAGDVRTTVEAWTVDLDDGTSAAWFARLTGTPTRKYFALATALPSAWRFDIQDRRPLREPWAWRYLLVHVEGGERGTLRVYPDRGYEAVVRGARGFRNHGPDAWYRSPHAAALAIAPRTPYATWTRVLDGGVDDLTPEENAEAVRRLLNLPRPLRLAYVPSRYHPMLSYEGKELGHVESAEDMFFFAVDRLGLVDPEHSRE